MQLKSISVAAAAASAALFLAMPAHAITTVFSTTLGAAGEPVPTSTASGAAVVSFDDSVNAVTVLMSFAGLANTAPFGHIHCCTVTPGTGGSAVALGFTPLPATTTGSYISVFNLTPTAFSTLLAGTAAGRSYVNIHTPGTYASGEIRGFLAPVPEPETYALLLSGLAVVGWVARRQKRVA